MGCIDEKNVHETSRNCIKMYSVREVSWVESFIATVIPYILWLPLQILEMFNNGRLRSLMQTARQTSGIMDKSHPGVRSMTTQRISDHMELVLSEKVHPPSTPRPLTLIYTWLMAKPNYVKKYMDMFTERGIDVLKIQITPMDLMLPTTRSQVCAQEVLEYLKNNPQFDRILVYGFSVGGYAFCESLKKMHEVPEYNNLLARFVGHIWDSPVDVENMPPGVARSVTNNTNIQPYITKYVEWFMKVRHNIATQHYYAASWYFKESPINAPSLYLYAKNDHMSPPAINESVIQNWRKAGYVVHSRAFDKAPHCALSMKYPEEYKKMMSTYLTEIGFSNQFDKATVPDRV